MKSRLFNTPVCHNPVVHMAAGLSKAAVLSPGSLYLWSTPFMLRFEINSLLIIKKKNPVVDSSARNISEEGRSSYMRVLMSIFSISWTTSKNSNLKSSKLHVVHTRGQQTRYQSPDLIEKFWFQPGKKKADISKRTLEIEVYFDPSLTHNCI